LDRRLRGPQSGCGRGGEEKRSLPLPSRPAHGLVSILTELPQLLGI